jgi:tetratricopeptide (TPR) repeat protein
LSSREQGVLRQLSVFRGGLTAAGAEAVAGASGEELAALVDGSWLRLWPNGRYDLHELVRQYCAEKLEQEHAALTGETPHQVRERHYHYYAGILHGVVISLLHRETVSQTLAEFSNIQTAWRWALEHGSLDACLDMWSALNFTTEMVGSYRTVLEIWEVDAALLERQLTPDHPRRHTAAITLTWLRHGQRSFFLDLGLLEQGRKLQRQMFAALAHLAPGAARTELRIWTLFDVACLWQFEGKYRLAYRLMDQLRCELQASQAAYSFFGDALSARYYLCQMLHVLGEIAYFLGDYHEARHLLEQVLSLRREIGDKRDQPINLVWLGRVQLAAGQIGQATETLQSALQLSQELGDRFWLAEGQQSLGMVAEVQGHVEWAHDEYARSLAMARQIGGHDLLMLTLAGLGRVALLKGDRVAAHAHFDEALAAFTRLGTAHSNWIAPVKLGLGWTALAAQDGALAEQRFRQVLEQHRRAGFDTLEAVAGLGEVLRGQGQPVQAAALLGYVAQHPATTYATRMRVAASLSLLDGAADMAAPSEQAVAAILGRPLSLVGG